jgi:hypothetical protein
MKKIKFTFRRINDDRVEVLAKVRVTPCFSGTQTQPPEDGDIEILSIEQLNVSNSNELTVEELQEVEKYIMEFPEDFTDIKVCKIVGDGSGMTLVVDGIAIYIQCCQSGETLNYFLNLYTYLGYTIDLNEYQRLNQKMERRIIHPQKIKNEIRNS